MAQFAHNADVAARLAVLADYDWAVIALFYASLHLAQAYLVRRGVFADTHVRRERQMLMLPELESVLDAYRTLRDRSEDARYECRRFSEQEYEAIRGSMFQRVVMHVQTLVETR